MDKKKRKKSFWYTVAALGCILIYILIPVLKLTGIIQNYNTTLTSFLIIVGAVIYMVGRRADINDKEEDVDDPSKHFEENPDITENIESVEDTKKDGE